MLNEKPCHNLLRRSFPITRAAVKAGSWSEDEDGELLEKGENGECDVCLEVLSADSFRRQLTESKCKHETYICTLCLRQAIRAKVETSPWDKIRCPFSGCEHILKPAMIRKYLQGELLENYSNYIATFKIRNLRNFRWCLNLKCGTSQVHSEGRKNLRVICHACKSESCFLHQIPLGEGNKCRDCQETSDAKAFIGTKPCPRCKAPTIMVLLGCDRAHSIGYCGYYWRNFPDSD
ncbi:hypothetical protein DID88_005376 [Monilinia fructigena]|uniref:RBR-type E3 ubiquitin transferase n=1 Tax=Monilinia fructigena TaxID=38457 RepID=A0A395J0W2_9HELO|nr:hypothetical protein DID88_005376 [Monilinia fructigena]